MTAKKKPAAKKPADSKPPTTTKADYKPKRLKLEHAGFDQHAAEAARQVELQNERDVHNARTGDPSI